MILKSVPKGGEFTYGVHGPSLAAIVPDNAFTLMPQEKLRTALRELDAITMGSVRSLNTKFELLRQGIGYILFYRIIQNLQQDRPQVVFMVYRRNKTNSEGRLASKLSLGAGGHIEGYDVSYHQTIDNELLIQTPLIDMDETTDDSVDREGGEEIKLLDKHDQDVTGNVMVDAHDTTVGKGFNKIGFVMDSKPEPGYVGNIHYGVVYAIDASEAVRFEMAEPQNDAVAWASGDELKNDVMFKNPDCPLEPWSQMIVDQIDAVEDYILSHFAPAA
jgi:predicted NUDIX family phosphoesterase